MTKEELKDWINKAEYVDSDGEYDESSNFWETRIYEKDGKLIKNKDYSAGSVSITIPIDKFVFPFIEEALNKKKQKVAEKYKEEQKRLKEIEKAVKEVRKEKEEAEERALYEKLKEKYEK